MFNEMPQRPSKLNIASVIPSPSVPITWLLLSNQIWLTMSAVFVFALHFLYVDYSSLLIRNVTSFFSLEAVGAFEPWCLACLSNRYLEGVIFCRSPPPNSAETPHPHHHQQPSSSPFQDLFVSAATKAFTVAAHDCASDLAERETLSILKKVYLLLLLFTLIL